MVHIFNRNKRYVINFKSFSPSFTTYGTNNFVSYITYNYRLKYRSKKFLSNYIKSATVHRRRMTYIEKNYIKHN